MYSSGGTIAAGSGVVGVGILGVGGSRSGLAFTGSPIGWMIALGIALIVLGLFAIRASRIRAMGRVHVRR